MGARLLDRHSVILLDMNGTFMFGEDRFGRDEDFHRTYLDQGGSQLDRPTVDHTVRGTLEAMSRDYEDPSRFEDFPPLLDYVHGFISDPAEALRIEDVIAYHECGRIPPEIAACLGTLRKTHRLGIVSNIWGRKALWLREFERAGVSDTWAVAIFSSDHRCIKPAAKLFQLALAAFDAPVSEFIFVGDSLRADILPAKRLGISTVWINPASTIDQAPDYSVASLLQLQDVEAEAR